MLAFPGAFNAFTFIISSTVAILVRRPEVANPITQFPAGGNDVLAVVLPPDQYIKYLEK